MHGGLVKKRILHIDMDAFFASIEARDLPKLEGKPIVVGSLPGNRGVVSTCSYESRKYGIRSGMPISEAVKRCPDAIFLGVNGRKYMHASTVIVKILNNYSPRVEPVSIDEAYLDITGSINIYGSEKKLAEELKKEIMNKLNLKCTIGIASTTVFAKMASNIGKPDGLVIFEPGKEQQLIAERKIIDLFGIGEKSEKIFKKIGIITIKDLINTPENVLEKYFGIYGKELKQTALGQNKREIHFFGSEEDEKSVGNERTLHEDTANIEKLYDVLLMLSQKVARRMRKADFIGKRITLKLRYSSFETHTIQTTLSTLTNNELAIFDVSKKLFQRLYRKKEKIRLLGISVSMLAKTKTNAFQNDLFKREEEQVRIFEKIDNLKNKYGDRIIRYGI